MKTAILFGATGFFISGFYLNADLPLSLGFVNIPAFLILRKHRLSID